MTPFTSLLVPVALSAVAVFVLFMVVHATPWHRREQARLPDEDAVMAALRPFAIPPNDYAVPHPGSGKEMGSPEYDAKRNAGPVMFLTVLPSGPWNFGRMIGAWLAFTLVVSASVAHLVGMIVPRGGDRAMVFHYGMIITFIAYAMGAVPMSIWYNRKWSTTFRNAVDAVLYGVVTGWIFAAMWPKA
jgi:hypothetical protein